MTAAFNVLFLCTHNSARSVMAEAILTKIGGGRFNAYRLVPTCPRAASRSHREVAHIGHDVAGLRSKTWMEFIGLTAPRLDFVITLCDMLDGQICADFGTLPVTGAWPLPDPVKFTGSVAERSALLNELYASLSRRIGIFAALPFASLDRMAMKARLDEIGGGGLPMPAEPRLMRVGSTAWAASGAWPLGLDRRHVSPGRRSSGRESARDRAYQRAEKRRGDGRTSPGI